MKPNGVLVASVIISDLHVRLRQATSQPYLDVAGRGVLAPGVAIPNEWWDRKSLIHQLEVGPPRTTADGELAVDFRARCEMEHGAKLRALVDGGIREQLEREIVPSLLIRLGLIQWSANTKPLEPITYSFGTPVEFDVDAWDPLPAATRSRPLAAVIQDLVRMSVGQAPSVDRNVVLWEATEQGLLASEHFAALVAKIGPGPAETPVVAARRSRVRVVDT